MTHQTSSPEVRQAAIAFQRGITIPGLKCSVCDKFIQIHDGFTERCARIERGHFSFSDDTIRDQENIKFDLYLCQECFLKDEDLCRFFNRLGHRVR